MQKGEVFWFRAVKLAIWTVAILLFFRFLSYLVGGNFRDFWLIIATASTMFITFIVYLLRHFQLPAVRRTFRQFRTAAPPNHP